MIQPPTTKPIETPVSPEAVDAVLAQFGKLPLPDRERFIRLLLLGQELQPEMTHASLDVAARDAVSAAIERANAARGAPETAASRAWSERVVHALRTLGIGVLTNGLWELLKLIGERVWLGGDASKTPQLASPSSVSRELAEAKPGDREVLRSAVMTPTMVNQWCAGVERDLTEQLLPLLRAAREAAPEAAGDLPPASEGETRRLLISFLGALASPPESR